MARHRPPSPASSNTGSLACDINDAISSSHTKINRLILERMPRAVPPQTDNPSTYVSGLLHFGAIYLAFESLWHDILGYHSEIAPVPYTYPFTRNPGQHDATPAITARTRHILEAAYWPKMLRSSRLKADVQAMTGWPVHVVDEQIRAVGITGRLGKFTAHIRESVAAKPHVLLAYSYCLYLALLSGGSYIRTELMYLQSDFWQATPDPIRPNMIECIRNPPSVRFRRHSSIDCDSHGLARQDPTIKMPLEFLDFDPPLGDNPRQKAKNLKVEFKRRFAEAEEALADPEREDITKEATVIFDAMVGVVGQLDKLFGAPQAKGHAAKASQPPTPSASTTPGMGFRLRDSIAVAKGRLLRTRQKSNGASVTATVPTVTEISKTSDSEEASNSRPSSMSLSSSEHRDSEHEATGIESTLSRDATIPGRGFRTIRYDTESGVPEKARKSDASAFNPHGFDGSFSDIDHCPMSRGYKTQEDVTQEAPNYALYAIVSNFVVFLGIAVVFAAYLYVRHTEMKIGPIEL